MKASKRRVRSTAFRTDPTTVPCSQQNVDNYSETLHLIGKGNGAEAKYDLTGQSRMDGWTPKLSCRLLNMNFSNLHRIYLALMEKNNPGRRPIPVV